MEELIITLASLLIDKLLREVASVKFMNLSLIDLAQTCIRVNLILNLLIEGFEPIGDLR